MIRPFARRLPAAVLTALLLSGCSPSSALRMEEPAASAPDEETADLEALYWARVEGARTFTQADVDFMTGMIGHHAQALVMAAMAPTHGANAEVQRLASRIDNSQRDEIETMQRWLRQRGQPVPEVHIMGTQLMVHGAGDHDMHMTMPGMLSAAQLQQLDDARGAEFDRLFLTFMIQHHTGAVTMVDDLFTEDGAAQDDAAFKLASDVQVDQRTEIARMHRILDALPASD